jgi:regulatory protein
MLPQYGYVQRTLMNTVTIIETQRDVKGRVKVVLDTGTTTWVSPAVAAEAGLHKGQTLSLRDLEGLKNSDEIHRSFNCALRYLGPRPKSEAEIRARLSCHGFNTAIIDQTVTRLKQKGFIDDAAFARFWRENRETFKPRSRRLIVLELKQKGIDSGIISDTVSGIDDELGAYHAAQRKIRSLSGLDYPAFRKRLGDFLKRRGFGFDLIDCTINRVWQETGNTTPN